MDEGPLIPFELLGDHFGRRDARSATVSALRFLVRAKRSTLFYRFTSSQSVSGGEMPSLLPFYLFAICFGRREALSSTVLALRDLFLAQRCILFYRFNSSRTSSGSEMPSLLPFPHSDSYPGSRDALSRHLLNTRDQHPPYSASLARAPQPPMYPKKTQPLLPAS